MNISRPYNISFSDTKIEKEPGIEQSSMQRIGTEEMKFVLNHGANAIIEKFKKYGYQDDEKKDDEKKNDNQPKLWKKEDVHCEFEGAETLKVSLEFKSFIGKESELDLYFENDLDIFGKSVKCTGTIVINEGADKGNLAVSITGIEHIMPEITKRISEKIKSEMSQKEKECNVTLTPKNKIIEIDVKVV